MKTIGIISDTHRLLRPEAIKALEGVDLIVHAGDIGSLEVIDGLKQNATPALLVGGTGLYLRALTGDLFEAPHIPDDVRKEIHKRLDPIETHELYKTLRKVDNVSAVRRDEVVLPATQVLPGTGKSVRKLDSSRLFRIITDRV